MVVILRLHLKQLKDEIVFNKTCFLRQVLCEEYNYQNTLYIDFTYQNLKTW